MFNFIITGEKFNNCQTYIMQNPNTSIIDYWGMRCDLLYADFS